MEYGKAFHNLGTAWANVCRPASACLCVWGQAFAESLYSFCRDVGLFTPLFKHNSFESLFTVVCFSACIDVFLIF